MEVFKSDQDTEYIHSQASMIQVDTENGEYMERVQ